MLELHACLGVRHSSLHFQAGFKDFASRHTVFVKWLTVQHSHLERHFTSTFTLSFGDKYTISIGLWKTKIDSAISLTVFLGLLSSGNFRLGTTGGRFPKWCFKEWCTWLNASMSVEQHVHIMLTAKPVYVYLLSVLKARLPFSGWSLWGHHSGLNLVLYQMRCIWELF